MAEAEIKHGRISMLAVVGWIAVDLGVRMPGSGYETIANSLVAHEAAVANGSLR
jgi:light-harvesting complex I chlorophyll a/b binding protein 1